MICGLAFLNEREYEQFTESMPDPDSWDDLIELFKQTLEAAERTVQKKSLH